MKIQIIAGSTRPNRIGKAVADWALNVAKERDDIEFELVDIQEYSLPLLDEAKPPKMNQYGNLHTKKWSDKISEADGYIFVTPEYNHSVPAAFKNAIDYLYYEWNNKSLGFIGYGSNGGSRSIEHWRGIAGELQLADVSETVMLYLDRDFENYSTFKPSSAQEKQLLKVVDQVAVWAKAFASIRYEDALVNA